MQSTSSALRNTHWLFIAVLSLLWLWQPRPAPADFYGEAIPSTEVREYYYADDSGLIYRGGIALRDPLGVHARNAQLADLGLSADRDLCSMTGLWTNYQALFRQEVLEDVFIGLVGNMAEAAIWTAFCSAEPVLCDLVKHMRAMARAGLQARLAQCGRVQEAAVRYGKGIWEESHRQCLEEKKHEGLSLDEAMEACGAHNFPLLNFVGQKVDNLNLIDEALTTTNAAPELKDLATAVLGEVTFNAGGATTRTGHAPGRVAAKYEEMAEEKEGDVVARLNRIHETGAVTEEDLTALSTPSVPMTPRYLLILARLPDGDRQVAAIRLARALAMDRLLSQVKALEEQLAAARKTPGGEAKAHALEVEMRSLRREVSDLVYYKRMHEEFVAKPMLEVMKEVAQEEETTSSFVEPGGGTDESKWAVRRLEDAVGHFGDIVGPQGTPAPPER